MRSIAIVLIMAAFMTACNSGKRFTSRKYTSGRYVSHAAHKQRIKKSVEPEKPLVFTKIEHSKQEPGKTINHEEKYLTAEATTPSSKKSGENKILNSLKKKTADLENNKLYKAFEKKVFKKVETKKQAEGTSGTGTKSLISVILAGLGVILDVAGFVLALISVDYIFIALIAVGAVFGLVALIMGIGGIKEYKREKQNGNRNTPALVLGIIGTAVGGAAIIIAAYLALYAALIISAGGL